MIGQNKQELIKANVATVSALMKQYKEQFAAALPKHMTPDRLTRVALTELRKTPKLMECDPLSFVGAIMLCAQLGLEPGGSLGHIYLLPYGKNVNPIIGYRGMIDLARRSGQVVSLSAHEVYKNDFFEFEFGLHEKLCHRPNMKEARGDLIAVYAIAHLVGGGHQIEVMAKTDVDAIRSRSKAAGSGPWVTDYAEMAKKTVLRKLFKYLPVSIEVQRAATIDEQSDIGKFDVTTVLDTEEDSFAFDNETGEVLEQKSQSDQLAEALS